MNSHTKTLAACAGATIVFISVAFFSSLSFRKRTVKLAKLIWDGDAQFEELKLQLRMISTSIDNWESKLRALVETLTSVKLELEKLEGGVDPDGSGLRRRGALQKELGAAHSTLWKLQDKLDTTTVGDEETLRPMKKKLVKQLAKVMALSEDLQGKFSGLPVITLAATVNGEMRGYRVKADGTKTTFFNQDLDDEAKRLIGDITPKRIDPNDEAAAVNGTAAPSPPAGASAWNSAGTWEERDVSEWGRSRLEKLLVGIEVSCLGLRCS